MKRQGKIISILLLASMVLTLFSVHTVNAVEQSESFDTIKGGEYEPYTYTGKHFQIYCRYGGNIDGIGIFPGSTDNAVISSLNGEIITKIEMHNTYYSAEGVIAEPGNVSVSGNNITVTDINATSVKIGHDDTDYAQIDKIVVYYDDGTIPPETVYPLWVGGRQVTSDYLSNSDEGWSYDPETNVLALNNAVITGFNKVDDFYWACISADMDLTISLSGTNMVGNDGVLMITNSSDVVLTITGSGNLVTNSTGAIDLQSGKLIIDNTTLTAGDIQAPDIDIINGSKVSLNGDWSAIAARGTLTVKDSKVEANSKGETIRANDISISGNSEVRATATEQTGRAIAIYAFNSFEINGVEIVKPEEGKIAIASIYDDYAVEAFTVLDEDGNIASEAVIMSVTPEYTVISGASGTYTLDSGEDYTLTVKRNVNDGICFERFKSVELDGQVLTKDTDYTAVKGSVVITLNKATLNSLIEGNHTVTVNFDDGKVETSITVKKASTPSPDPEPTPVTPFPIPKTGIE